MQIYGRAQELCGHTGAHLATQSSRFVDNFTRKATDIPLNADANEETLDISHSLQEWTNEKVDENVIIIIVIYGERVSKWRWYASYT